MILLKIHVCLRIIIINAGKYKSNIFMEDIFMNKILVILIFLFLANVVSASTQKKTTYFIDEEFNEFLVQAIGSCSSDEPQKDFYTIY